jgi:hypothetical protein
MQFTTFYQSSFLKLKIVFIWFFNKILATVLRDAGHGKMQMMAGMAFCEVQMILLLLSIVAG